MRLRLVPSQTNWNFFAKSRLSFGISLSAMIVSIIAVIMFGLNFGIDFRGGTNIRTTTKNTVNIEEFRKALTPLELGDVLITEVFDPTQNTKNSVQIRIQSQAGDQAISATQTKKIEAALKQMDPELAVVAVESVGPKVSGELIQKALLAIILAISAVVIYIWLRFEWQFSAGAVAALIHDITLTIGIFSLLKIKFDLAIIAAILTIIGYSLNDTVVVFDRVRENLRKYKSDPLVKVLNRSINETLSRTVMTSFTTLLALFALFVLGGDVIRGFVFAMIWGIFVGTYSSVFVASAILLRLGLSRDTSAANG